jgi:hypothetical protein
MTQFAILTAFLLSIATAQDVPPPPKPTDDGPSLEATMKFIQDKLNGQGDVNYVVTNRNSRADTATELGISVTVSDANANPASCIVSFTKNVAFWESHEHERIELSFREAEKLAVSSATDVFNRESASSGHPEETHVYAPSVFLLTVKMLEGKRVRTHSGTTGGTAQQGHQATWSDWVGRSVSLVFREEEMAQRVAKAMLHAIELCGGGNEDPF